MIRKDTPNVIEVAREVECVVPYVITKTSPPTTSVSIRMEVTLDVFFRLRQN